MAPLHAPLTQRTDVISHSLHHKVCRFPHHAPLQTRTPGPDLLRTSLWTYLHLNGTKMKKSRISDVEVWKGGVRACVPAGDVLSTPGDGDAVCPR